MGNFSIIQMANTIPLKVYKQLWRWLLLPPKWPHFVVAIYLMEELWLQNDMGFFLHLQWQTPNKELLNIKPTLSWKGSQRAQYLLELHKLVSNEWLHSYQFLINNPLVLTIEEKSCILPNFFLMFRGSCFNNLGCLNYTFLEIMCATFELWIASSYLGSGTGLSPVLWETFLQFQILWTA